MKIFTRVVMDIGSGKILESDSFEHNGPVLLAKGGTSGSSSSEATIAPELKPLYSQTGEKISEFQRSGPQLIDYTGANPTKVEPLSGTQNKSLGLVNQNLDAAMSPLDQAPIVQAGHKYFEGSIAPSITNSATLSGLGRSTALENAKAAAEAQVALPLLQNEQTRRDALVNQGLTAGDVERSVGQQANNAESQDFLRRQALAEQSLFGIMGSLPTTIGQTGTSRTSGGSSGLFK